MLPPVSPSVPSVVVDETEGPWGRATAVFSPDRSYRYLLTRTWDESSPVVNFVMLNPSTADAFALDPTNRRCVDFAQRWGCGALVTTNVFAWRSTDPTALRTVADPIGPANDAVLVETARRADLVIAAWGVHAAFDDRGMQVQRMLVDAGVELQALRLTKGGHPGHPLYVPAATVPALWSAPDCT